MMWIALAACSGGKDQDTALPYNEPPVIGFELPDDRKVEGDSLDLALSVSDPDGVDEVSVYYRTSGNRYWEELVLWNSADSDSADVSGTVEALSTPGLDFYFKATDLGSPAAISFHPAAGAEDPSFYPVSPKSLALPFEEGFELEEGQGTLMDLDWWTPSDVRDTYAFGLTGTQANGGTYSVYHPQGSESAPELSDWLISPPLDFSGETGVMVGWWEYGLSVTSESRHSLYVSLGSRLPDDGDFVEAGVIDLPGGEDWERHRFVDLSEWAGEPLVYLAWRWQGTYADDWYIDDVSVRALAPDFLSTFSHSPSAVSPGDTASLTAVIENITGGEAEELEATISFPGGGGEASEGASQLGPVEGFATVETVFGFQLAADLDDNSYLPLQLGLSVGEDEWVFEHQLLIGSASYASLGISFEEDTVLEAKIGVGDPEDPEWFSFIHSGPLDAGEHLLQLEITDQHQWLPPTPTERWFLSLASSAAAEVSRFDISDGDELHSIPVPVTTREEESILYQLPEPPEPWIYSTTPYELTPGDSGASLVLGLQNLGSGFSGAVTARVFTEHPELSIEGGEEISLGSLWGAGEFKNLVGPTLSLDATHLDSTPVGLYLELQDELETWLLPLEIDVPWPVLKVIGVVVEDSGNGILDPDESADLELTVANIGGMDAFGLVRGSLSVSSGSGLATVSNCGLEDAAAGEECTSQSFGFLDAGASEDEDDYSVSVSGGSAGDVIEFDFLLDDGTSTYSDSFEIILGETPWLSLAAFPDTEGDVLDPAALDIVGVEYRLNGGMLELRIESSDAISPTSAFIEIWGSSNGGEQDFYRWVVQGGVGSFQGYSSGFQPIGDLAVEFPDATHMLLRWDPEDMGLSQNTVTLGLASGWCGPPAYFCDHFPDGWGYPYVSYSPSGWFTLTF
jgi:hypothetical protein